MIGGGQVGEVGDHERVPRRRGELLDHADHVERDDVEVAGAVVEYPQAQEIAEVQRVVGDRLLGDEDPVRPRLQP